MNWAQLAGPVIAAALGGVLSALVIEAMRGRPGRKDGGVVLLSYGPVARFVVLGGLALPSLCAIAAWRAETIAGVALFVFVGLALTYFVVMAIYLSFFVTMAFNEMGVYYHSPLRGGRVITWGAVERLGYSDLVQTHYLKASNGEMFWLSRCMNGFDEFAAVARDKMN